MSNRLIRNETFVSDGTHITILFHCAGAVALNIVI